MIKQYGAIPFIRNGGELKLVLVTSASGYWIFPKGNFEKKLGTCGTAEMEAFEEAGVRGDLYPHTVYRTNVMIRGGKKVRMMLYPLEVQKVCGNWPEMHRRKREIVIIDDVGKFITSDALLKCVDRFSRDFLFEE